MSNEIHIGSMILKALQERNLSPGCLAEAINCTRGHAYKLLNKQSIDTNLLIRISKALNNNFFQDISNAIGDNPD